MIDTEKLIRELRLSAWDQSCLYWSEEMEGNYPEVIEECVNLANLLRDAAEMIEELQRAKQWHLDILEEEEYDIR